MKEFWSESDLGDHVVHLIKSQSDIESLPLGVDYVFVEFTDWKVVPAENLVAKYNGSNTKVIARVDNLDDIILLSNVIECGLDGFLTDMKTFESYESYSARSHKTLGLIDVFVTNVDIVSEADLLDDRVCLDCTSRFNEGEGFLIGSNPGFLFLVNAETLVNPYVKTRPWRVNAGVSSNYVMLANGGFSYLSDLVSGDFVLAVDLLGNTHPKRINRVKIEDRSCAFIKAQYKSHVGSVCLQTAETVRLDDIAVTNLKPNIKIKAYVADPKATHFSSEVNERVEYK